MNMAEKKWWSVRWLVAAGGVLLFASCRAPAPETGRYQMAVTSIGGGGGESYTPVTTTVYVMEMETGRILQRDIKAKEWKFVPSSVPVSPSVFDDAQASYERAEEAKKEKKMKADAEQGANDKLFRTGTLEEQVKAAEKILVIQCAVDKDNTRKVMVRSEEGMEQKTVYAQKFTVTEVLKKTPSREPATQVSITRSLPSQSGPPVVRPVSLGQTRLSLRELGDVGQKWITEMFRYSAIEDNETLLIFGVSSEYNPNGFHFIFASERMASASDEPRFNQYYEKVIRSAREPAELVEDIKAILAKDKEGR